MMDAGLRTSCPRAAKLTDGRLQAEARPKELSGYSIRALDTPRNRGIGESRPLSREFFLSKLKSTLPEAIRPGGNRISVGAAAIYTGLAESTLNKLRMTGSGPRFLKLSARRVVYDTNDLDEWLASKRRISTSDSGSVEAA